jgi:hypothetical protein
MRMLIIAALASLSLPALAEEQDPLCGAINDVVARAGETKPFASLSKAVTGGDNFGPTDTLLAGLEPPAKCQVYIAGTRAFGVAGGGTHNQMECTLLRLSITMDPEAIKKTAEVTHAMTKRIQACFAESDWSAETDYRLASYQSPGLRLYRQGSDVEIVVRRHSSSRRQGSGNYSALLSVRTPNTAPPKPPVSAN